MESFPCAVFHMSRTYFFFFMTVISITLLSRLICSPVLSWTFYFPNTWRQKMNDTDFLVSENSFAFNDEKISNVSIIFLPSSCHSYHFYYKKWTFVFFTGKEIFFLWTPLFTNLTSSTVLPKLDSWRVQLTISKGNNSTLGVQGVTNLTFLINSIWPWLRNSTDCSSAL